MKSTCTICGSETVKLFNAKVLMKYDVDYFQCKHCGFIETEQPHWLKEAYDSVITQLDIGLIWRNQLFSGIIEKVLLAGTINPDGKFLDYGGGYGMFVRMMRDKGFDFYRQDIYCENLFAKYFDISDIPEQKKFEAVTAFEVFEHLENPIAELEKMLSMTDTVIFSTELQPAGDLSSESWWYFIPETGQHISLYSFNSLKHMAERYSLYFYSDKTNLHIFSKHLFEIDPFEVNTQTWHDRILNRIRPKHEVQKRESLLPKDFEFIRKKSNK